jgi:hypothetical protein
MKKNDIIIKEEFETQKDTLTDNFIRKHFRVTRKCVRILEGIRNPETGMMEHTDISSKDTDINDGKQRYVVTYDNIAKVEIP